METKVSWRCRLGFHRFGKYMNIGTAAGHWKMYTYICKRCGKETRG